MVFKKITFLLFLILINSVSAVCQVYSDTIFTSSDTIVCKITLINNHNIFYSIKKHKSIINTYLQLKEVQNYKSDSSTTSLNNVVNEKLIYEYDTLKKVSHEILFLTQLDFPLSHVGLAYSFYKKNHNLQLGFEYLQLQRSYLRGDPVDIWDKSFLGFYVGYRYILKSNISEFNLFPFFSYTIFNATYIEYQRGFPFEKEHNELIFLNTGGMGLNFRPTKPITVFLGIGLSSSKGFFLNFEEPYLNIRLGLEYRFIK